MSPVDAVRAALVFHLAGGVLLLIRGSRSTERAAAVLSAIGSLAGLAGAAGAFLAPRPALLVAPWHVPGGAILLRLDALAAAFLLVIFLVSGLGSIYGLGYWSREKQPRSAARLRFFYALMTVGLALVVMAAHAVLFLLAWELMAVSAFFLVATDDVQAEVRRAAWVYLVATHAGTACLFAAFALLRAGTGSFEIQRVALSPSVSVVFLLAVVGFGMKAGIVPLHFWLPAAHASAPSHVSALMSGVMLKAGIYGILRFSSLVDVPPLWWGLLLAGLGALLRGLGHRHGGGPDDIKRALAYSSIENMGIVWLGIGLAARGPRARPALVGHARVLWQPLPRLEPRLLQVAPLLRIGRGHARDAHAEHGAPRRARPPDAGHREPLPRGRARRSRAAALQRIHRRVAHRAWDSSTRSGRAPRAGGLSRSELPRSRSPARSRSRPSSGSSG